ncbi:electron transport complex subunit RsxC [Motilimonas pumila]|uniref:Ion-translocating oxidoreductase complex subunit C n=1 Tax=Motilimonas pumila TaxID=2303987 RepID=A0A418YFF5_9GAMM|nr:electron transport complex subunit RsxC [Motilimonas pumila]RJG48105.1 electron transport complex subunit RsxC [Motilimonas pumila]
MKELLNRIRSGKLWRYAGGVFPAERKHYSNKTAIGQAIIPEQLVIPVSQHLGESADILVKVGDLVQKGQPLTACNNFRALPVHASSSGTVSAIELRPSCHASGIFEQAIVINTDGLDTWQPRSPRDDISSLDKHQLIDIVHQAGIAGKGGAGFPAHLKLSGKADIEVLIINGIECEPYITSDDVLMREYAQELFQGIEVLEKITQCGQTIIAVEHNKPEAAKALEAFATDTRQVKVVPTKYPTGGEKQLIEVLTGMQVPANGYAIDMGILMHNVGTTLAIKRAVFDDEPLISRIVTLTGQAMLHPGNRHVLLGTPVAFMLQQHQFKPTSQPRVIIGGPMMGFTLPNFNAPVIKTTNCILAPTEAELPLFGKERACIRCGECAEACPVDLLPQQLYWYAKSQDHEKLEEYNLFDCIECGACAYVCPSEIPLVQYYRVGKAEIKTQTVEADKAEVARKRHEARAERLERDKQEREAKHKAAAEKRKAQLQQKSDNTAADTQKDAVAEALARAKQNKASDDDSLDPAAARKLRKEQARAAKAAKQALENEQSQSEAVKEDKAISPVAAAIARAKAKKANNKAEDEDNGKTAAKTSQNPAVAAAIARAKAKKAQANDSETQHESDVADTEQDETAKTHESKASKNTAVAAAIARAKAKKAQANNAQAQAEAEAQQESDVADTEQNETAKTPESKASKNPAVAAAIARAKAKKAQANNAQAEAQQESDFADTEQDETAKTHESKASKNPAVAAAIARAKAKKAQANNAQAEAQQESDVADTEQNETAKTPESKASKNPAVAAAIARAKAKKAQAKGAETQHESDAVDKAENETAKAQESKASNNPAVAAAIAKAKAKKALQQAVKDKAVDDSGHKDKTMAVVKEDVRPKPKSAAVAAAIAKAKAKKAQQQENDH